MSPGCRDCRNCRAVSDHCRGTVGSLSGCRAVGAVWAVEWTVGWSVGTVGSCRDFLTVTMWVSCRVLSGPVGSCRAVGLSDCRNCRISVGFLPDSAKLLAPAKLLVTRLPAVQPVEQALFAVHTHPPASGPADAGTLFRSRPPKWWGDLFRQFHLFHGGRIGCSALIFG